jgi:hypothetical protein
MFGRLHSLPFRSQPGQRSLELQGPVGDLHGRGLGLRELPPGFARSTRALLACERLTARLLRWVSFTTEARAETLPVRCRAARPCSWPVPTRAQSQVAIRHGANRTASALTWGKDSVPPLNGGGATVSLMSAAGLPVWLYTSTPSLAKQTLKPRRHRDQRSLSPPAAGRAAGRRRSATPSGYPRQVQGDHQPTDAQ